ncbi:ATP-binding protein [Paenalkalicoccus suaedae]|uniref:ATP-binding protein n=1 Tax=Paenalkalicoccus suaedae TaxID=2592382 RepID=A0A859FBJ7_9BACI|nr:ATP-binding protein [Paenalkalicoccus suaedae]QKS70162.1 ATP-binding protein [Paenalkalicoccus suaedae]
MNRIYIVDISHSILDYELKMKEIREFISNYLHSSMDLFDVAVSEAIMNSVEQAMRLGITGGATRVKLRCFNHRMLARVKGLGPGFEGNDRIKEIRENRERYLKKTLFEESGRGLLIMEAATDYLLYNSYGNDVILIKKKHRSVVGGENT